MNFRTDLALEVRENLEGSKIDGVECTSFESAGAEITRLRVTDRRGEEILGKPRGEYITVQSQSFARSSRISDELIDAVAQELSRLLPAEFGSTRRASRARVRRQAKSPRSYPGYSRRKRRHHSL